ncbi:hypothetical protein WOLCODRAFT_141390 [Wolfiporia cocos MD-104 SS10]|uniref:Uncharacterized protein n=1 Tax=Wolfiporia cocos (strain MD-104) TaxID=742152 RepID=A0A2H3IY60_WOLCO|nr:hypothetical protein WOLCODRAFT_141390 [Wolfiporia cocos MD-104 SS10]
MSGQFWFPSMSVPEIVDAFTGWGYMVSHEEVARPTPDFVLGIYSACLKQVTGITVESIQGPVEAALARVSNPDIYRQALTHHFLLYHLQRFATAAKFHGFCAKDLNSPEPERTRAIFSAFINFVKFSEQCETFITGLRERSAGMVEERDSVAQQLTDAHRKIAYIKVKREEDEPKCEALRHENTAMTEQLVKYKETQLVFLRDREALRQEIEAVLQSKEGVNRETLLITEQIGRTRSRVVQSPDRIRRNIVTMSATAAEDKRTLVTNEAKIRDLQTKIAALLNIEKDVRSCVEQLQTYEKEMQALDAAQKELADIRDHLDLKKSERTELLLKRERVFKQLSNAQEKFDRAQRHAEDKRLASQQALERLQREYEEMAVERRENDKQVEELRREADEVERKMAEHMKQSQAELDELLTEYWRLRHETEVYMETLAEKLGMQVTST